MIKLNLTHEFTSQDIKDYAAPGIIYKAHTHWTFETRQAIYEFSESKENVGLALEALSRILVSIDHDGIVYPVSLEWLKEYKASIEEQNPEMSDWYICQLARDIINYLWGYLDDRLKNSQRPLSPYENGSGQKQNKSVVKA